jgi:hypothetical protein
VANVPCHKRQLTRLTAIPTTHPIPPPTPASSSPDTSDGRKAVCQLQTFVQISHTFFHLLPHVFAQLRFVSCQRNRHKNRNKRHLSRKSSTTHRKSPQMSLNTAISRPKPVKARKSSTTAHKCQTSPEKEAGFLKEISRISSENSRFSRRKIRRIHEQKFSLSSLS